MSVIVVKKYKDRIEIAADKQSSGTYGGTKNLDTSKLTKIDNIIFGSVGYLSHHNLMIQFLATNKLSEVNKQSMLDFIVKFQKYIKELNSENKLYNDYIFIVKKKVFFIDSYFTVEEITDNKCIGSGGKFAQVALHYGKSVSDAVRVACKYDLYCGGKINKFKVKL